MIALDYAGGAYASRAADAPWRVPVRAIAIATGFTCGVAQILSHVGGAGGDAESAPTTFVVGQALWSAAQVGLLIVLLCLWRAHRRWWVAALRIVAVAALPFAIYAISPGAWLLTPLLLASCALAWNVPDFGVTIADAPARGTSILLKVEFLGFVCNLFSQMYNYEFGRGLVPYWAALYGKVADVIGFTPDPAAISRAMFTLGLPGVSLPAYIRSADHNPMGCVVFFLIWTVLPCLYVLYFAACAKLAKDTPGTRIQQALCLIGVVHFLFLTDIVDYQYGRGLVNAAAEWCHWTERLAWRIAILLPLYQNLASGHFRRGNGALGVVLHYGLAIWAVAFLVYMVCIYDSTAFYEFATGHRLGWFRKLFGRYNHWLGYPGALVIMTCVYGFMAVATRCKKVSAVEIEARAAA